jgi:uncharacterized membrane protein YedE/YeeE
MMSGMPALPMPFCTGEKWYTALSSSSRLTAFFTLASGVMAMLLPSLLKKVLDDL